MRRTTTLPADKWHSLIRSSLEATENGNERQTSWHTEKQVDSQTRWKRYTEREREYEKRSELYERFINENIRNPGNGAKKRDRKGNRRTMKELQETKIKIKTKSDNK